MDRQGNTYTILYSIVLVVVVAALLAVVSLSLQPAQTKNKENEKRQNILSAIHITSTPEASATEFEKYIKEQYIVNSKGEEKEGNAFSIDIAGEYAKPVEQRQLPIFVAEVDGSKKYILPVCTGRRSFCHCFSFVILSDPSVPFRKTAFFCNKL